MQCIKNRMSEPLKRDLVEAFLICLPFYVPRSTGFFFLDDFLSSAFRQQECISNTERCTSQWKLGTDTMVGLNQKPMLQKQ